jgi:hypothetical protein
VKRIAAWLAGATGAAIGYRWLRREREPASEVAPGGDERADELRAKLAETRAEEEQPPTEPSPPESLEDRRRRVHEEGRAAIDEMRSE